MMKKSTKGALAAGAAGVLLLGGAGSLAFWTDTGQVGGGTITAGNMSITDPSCGQGWVIDGGEQEPNAPFDPATGRLVPGDVIQQTCTMTFNGEGDHLRATVDAEPGVSDGLFETGDLVLDVGALEVNNGGTWAPVPASGLTELDDGKQVRLQVQVEFLGAADNTTQNVASNLQAINILATQVHN